MQNTLSAQDIVWADQVFVMEDKRKQQVKEKFSKQFIYKKVIVLDISDDYQYMDEALI